MPRFTASRTIKQTQLAFSSKMRYDSDVRIYNRKGENIMKSEFIVEFSGKQANEKELIAKIKKDWVASGKLVKEIKDLKLYAKPEDGRCYYTINDAENGSIELF